MDSREEQQSSTRNTKLMKKQSFAARVADKTLESEHEQSIYDVEEEFTEMAEKTENCEDEDFDEYGESRSTMKTMRTSEATTNVTHPLAEDFFTINMSLSFFDESEDTIEDIESFTQEPLEKEEDFFEKLGQVPDIQQISAENVTQVTPSASMASSLKGYFVDPLTGKVIITQPEKDESVEELELLEEEAATGGDADRTSMEDVEFECSFGEFDTGFPMPAVEVVVCQDEEDLTVLFEAHNVESDTEVVVKAETKSLDFNPYEQAERFLDDLVNLVIRYCEYERSAEMVRKNLDKHALFNELMRSVHERDVEDKVNYFLNRKCVEFHRRKHNLRYIQEEKPEKAAQERAYYKEKVENLDHLLGKEMAMMKKNNEQIADLSFKADEEEEKLKQEITDFENLVKKTLRVASLRPALEKLVETQLGYISSLRDEISSTRSVIIQRQHTLATLQARLHDLEDIGNGLNLADYENLMREFQALGKKIEDRNRELVKMHNRFHHNLHSMAHMKLKSEVTMSSISVQLKDLKDLELEEFFTRQRLFRLNLIHKRTRQQINDLSLQCGLLDKPPLLRDYDETMERLLKQRAIVEHLRKLHSEWEAKLHHLQMSQDVAPANTAAVAGSKAKKEKTDPTADFVIDVQEICLNF